MHPKKLLIIGNYGAGNLGDDAILGGILEDLRALNYKGEIRVTTGPIKTSLDIYKKIKKVPFIPTGLRSRFNRNQSKEAQQNFKEANFAIVGGGGLFTDAETLKAPYIWAKQISVLIRNQTPYIFYGQSFGPLKSMWSRYWAKKAAKHAKAILVRDEASKKQLEAWGLKVSLGTDPAFSWLIEEQQKRPKQEEILVLILREWPKIGLSQWKQWSKPINEYAKKRHLKVILMTMEPQQKKELENLKKLDWELYIPSSAREVLFALQKAKQSIVMRLHGGIFAVVAGKPSLILSYSQKVEAFFTSLYGRKTKQILSPVEWSESDLRHALKELDLKTDSTLNLEEKIQLNRDFLASHLNSL